MAFRLRLEPRVVGFLSTLEKDRCRAVVAGLEAIALAASPLGPPLLYADGLCSLDIGGFDVLVKAFENGDLLVLNVVAQPRGREN